MRLEGNNITKAALMQMDGWEEFAKKRKALANKQVSAGIGKASAMFCWRIALTYKQLGDFDRTVCGLD